MHTLKGMSESLWNQILLCVYGADQYIVTQDFPLSYIAHLPEEKKKKKNGEYFSKQRQIRQAFLYKQGKRLVVEITYLAKSGIYKLIFFTHPWR